ncbi:hypothetical protein SAMN05216388_100919 [Halorientalis persicus]|uniref:Uncharacterized protein n=1 Tax=Halorientalis persicus TaxID=1367881 RepID=A0A1H8MJL9_9EURY|nr:hypothetical protein SAMN05216388_100919 [Halorientalis persicus]
MRWLANSPTNGSGGRKSRKSNQPSAKLSPGEVRRPMNENKTCCDNPDIVELPKRRFKLPDAKTRDTCRECMNCGQILD